MDLKESKKYNGNTDGSSPGWRDELEKDTVRMIKRATGIFVLVVLACAGILLACHYQRFTFTTGYWTLIIIFALILLTTVLLSKYLIASCYIRKRWLAMTVSCCITAPVIIGLYFSMNYWMPYSSESEVIQAGITGHSIHTEPRFHLLRRGFDIKFEKIFKSRVYSFPIIDKNIEISESEYKDIANYKYCTIKCHKGILGGLVMDSYTFQP